MKRIFLAIILAAFAFVVPAAAQSVLITPKKVTYTRPKPISEYKTTFTVNYPKVKASTPALSRRIEGTISYAKVLELNVQEEIREIQWLHEADFEVNYNARGVLTISLWMHGSAAYPDGSEKTIVVDLKTGNRLRPVDVFANLPGLAAMARKAHRAEIVKASKEIKENPENGDADPAELFRGKKFTTTDLSEFAVNDKGVTFIYDYGFAHVIQALQPEGRYAFSWAQLKPYIKRSGLLAKFVR